MVNQETLTNLRVTTVNQIEELLKEHDRVATVWCTGLGKSRYLIYPLCQRLPGKKLILEPNTEIINYLVDLAIEEYNGQFITYQSLLHKNINDLVEAFSQFDYIFLDEVHRALAEKWR